MPQFPNINLPIIVFSLGLLIEWTSFSEYWKCFWCVTPEYHTRAYNELLSSLHPFKDLSDSVGLDLLGFCLSTSLLVLLYHKERFVQIFRMRKKIIANILRVFWPIIKKKHFTTLTDQLKKVLGNRPIIQFKLPSVYPCFIDSKFSVTKCLT